MGAGVPMVSKTPCDESLNESSNLINVFKIHTLLSTNSHKR